MGTSAGEDVDAGDDGVPYLGLTEEQLEEWLQSVMEGADPEDPAAPKRCLVCPRPLEPGQTLALTGNRHSGCRVDTAALREAVDGGEGLDCEDTLALLDEHAELTEQVRRQGAQLSAISRELTRGDETARAILEVLGRPTL
ncbi:hypothetical protein Bequi_09865 [Brachybacterium sp. JHP9]|uniref:Uncharacterized protein n=1 Tax=Brachybacterium equifaecis TaxID=2910770 RepID=A0ABT0R183_9MICO|nr:hypothetical protein [Brachybacterium equifaecis]MCL6423689.1 hypothetical protein [Brachybacterium equifaecis]